MRTFVRAIYIAQAEITINVPLFKKLRDIIFFWWENHFMSHFEGHFEGVKRGVKGSKGVCAVNFLALLILLKGKV